MNTPCFKRILLLTLVSLAARGSSVAGEATVVKEPLLLENPFCRLAVDPEHGRLLRLTDKIGNIDLAPPPELAENFRLLVPLPDDPYNFIHGREQRLSKTEWSESGVELHWGSPLRDSRRREYDLAARMSIELQGRAIVFRFNLENRTEQTVWEVWYPCIGGLLQFGNATWWAGNMSTARRIFPELVETVGHYQPYDFVGINDAVRHGHTVMVAPHHFNRTMKCETWRGLSAYIREVKRIRDELADTFFFGELLDATTVQFEGDGPREGVEYAAYRDRKEGKRGCILTNRNARPATIQLAGFGGRAHGQVRVYLAFEDPRSSSLPVEITIGPERLAFVVEK